MSRSRNQRDTFVRFAALICVLCVFALEAQLAMAQSASVITVEVNKPGADISPTLFGLFFEDINFGADGGLYPERVKNRSFEFPDPLMGWKKIERVDTGGTLSVLDEDPINSNNAHYLRLKAEGAGKSVGVQNEGFRGMGL